MVFRLRISESDLRRMRFAYSPLAEVTESLHMLSCGQVAEQHRPWFEMIRGSLRRVDMPLLRMVVPPGLDVPRFMLMGAADPATSIERQLRLVAGYPPDRLRKDLSEVWNGAGLPPAAERLVSDGASRLADTLWDYWQAAIGPYWARIRLSSTPTWLTGLRVWLTAASKASCLICIPG